MLDAIRAYFTKIFQEPKTLEETTLNNAVYTVRDVFINNRGLLIVTYFKDNRIEVLAENKRPLQGDLIFIFCHKTITDPALLKHTSTTTKTLNGFSLTTEKYDLFLPDTYNIKGAM